jgi:Mn-dependent DtxR family transcriptional regulator
MTFDTTVLRVMLRLARRREAADIEAVALRIRGQASAVRGAIRRLQASGLVYRRGLEPPRLTLSGLAVALATLPRAAAVANNRSVRTSRAA